jgi:hypothetical protein
MAAVLAWLVIAKETPQQCLHDSLVVHTSSGHLNPRMVGTGTHAASVKTEDTAIPTVTESDPRT